MFVITMYFEGPKEDWYCQLGHPRKIKNLLTYLLSYLLTRLFWQQCIAFQDGGKLKSRIVSSYSFARNIGYLHCKWSDIDAKMPVINSIL